MGIILGIQLRLLLFVMEYYYCSKCVIIWFAVRTEHHLVFLFINFCTRVCFIFKRIHSEKNCKHILLRKNNINIGFTALPSSSRAQGPYNEYRYGYWAVQYNLQTSKTIIKASNGRGGNELRSHHKRYHSHRSAYPTHNCEIRQGHIFQATSKSKKW